MTGAHGKEEKARVRINVEIIGDPAAMILELQRRGLIRDYADAINQAVPLLYDKALDRDMKLVERSKVSGSWSGSKSGI